MTGTGLTRVAVALDGSDHADHALDLAISLARHYAASLLVVSVVPPLPTVSYSAVAPPAIPEDLTPFHEELLTRAKKKAEDSGVRDVVTVLLEGHVSDTLVTYFKHHPTDLLVMGSRGLSASTRLFLGSVSDFVVHHTPCPILIVPHHEASSTPTSSSE